MPGVVESLKIITRAASMRIAGPPFIMPPPRIAARSPRLIGKYYEKERRTVSELLPELATDAALQYREVIVDNCCMQLVAIPNVSM